MHITESDAEITGTKRQFMSKIKHIFFKEYEAFMLWLKYDISSLVSAGIVSAN